MKLISYYYFISTTPIPSIEKIYSLYKTFNFSYNLIKKCIAWQDIKIKKLAYKDETWDLAVN